MKGIIQAAKANMTGTPFQVEARYHATPCGRLGPHRQRKSGNVPTACWDRPRGCVFTVAREYPVG